MEKELLILYIDDQKPMTETISCKWKQNKFQNVEYPIFDAMVNAKESVCVNSQAITGNSVGKVYNIRLVRTNK